MTTLIERMEERYTWAQVEAAVLAIPLQRFVAALRLGLSEEDGCRMARAQMADELRRELLARATPTDSGTSTARSTKRLQEGRGERPGE